MQKNRTWSINTIDKAINTHLREAPHNPLTFPLHFMPPHSLKFPLNLNKTLLLLSPHSPPPAGNIHFKLKLQDSVKFLHHNDSYCWFNFF